MLREGMVSARERQGGVGGGGELLVVVIAVVAVELAIVDGRGSNWKADNNQTVQRTTGTVGALGLVGPRARWCAVQMRLHGRAR